MRNIQLLVTFILAAQINLVGCESKMITKEYDSSKKIQVIPIIEKSVLAVQDDRIIDEESLYRGMSKENESVAGLAAEAKKYRRISEISLKLQTATLIGCLLATPLEPVIILCGTSIGLGMFGFIPYGNKAEEKKAEAINQHNQTDQTPVKSSVMIH